MINLRIANGCGPTGRLLRELLEDRGVQVGREGAHAVVGWGVGGTNQLPTLNASVGRRNKLQELQRFHEVGISAPRVYTNIPPAGAYPVLARRVQHHGGLDIRLCRDRETAVLRRAQGRDFFTEYLAQSQTEFRYWIYRRRHLGCYEKVRVRPAPYRLRRRIGRNHRLGYAFELVPAEQVRRDGVELAARAVESLGLDFGAVDVIVGRNGQLYVLEVNSAPGVEGEGRQVIQALADKIANWERLGYPRRNGDEENPRRAR